jgi:HEAT repeat protein
LDRSGPPRGRHFLDCWPKPREDGSQHANTTAAAALKSIDLTAARQVMTHFIPRLQDQDAQQRRTACAVLGSLGPVAKPAVPALLAVGHDPDELVRRNALMALASIGIPSPPIVAALLEGLRDSSSLVRQTAVTQFAFTVPLTQPVIAALTPLLNDPDRSIATLARSALDKAKPDDASTARIIGHDGPTFSRARLCLASAGPARSGGRRCSYSRSCRCSRMTGRSFGTSRQKQSARWEFPPSKRSSLFTAARGPDPVVREAVAEAIAGIEAAMAPAASSEKAARP